MMSKTNVFFCNCGHRIGRPEDKAPQWDGEGDRPPVYGVVAWHAGPHDGVLRGIRCAECKLNWVFGPSNGGDFVEVAWCCKEHRCNCTWEDV